MLAPARAHAAACLLHACVGRLPARSAGGAQHSTPSHRRPRPAQVEVRKLKAGEGGGGSGGAPAVVPAVVRACVARLPPGYARVEVDYMADDQIWGLDGFDT